MSNIVTLTPAALLAAAVCLLSVTTSSRAAPVLSLQLSIATANVGDTVTAKVLVTGASDLYGFEFDLLFNRAVVTALGVVEGDFFSRAGASLFIPGIIDNSTGLFGFNAGALQGAIPGGDGDGVLAEFSFNATAAGSSGFNFTNFTLLDSTLGAITGVTSRGASFVVSGGGGQVPEPATLALVLPWVLLQALSCRAGRQTMAAA